MLWSAFLSVAGRRRRARRSGRTILQQRAAAFPAPDGINPLRYDYAQSLLILMGIVGARAAARMREPVGPAARTGGGETARGLDSPCDWRRARSPRAAVPDGEPAAGGDRRSRSASCWRAGSAQRLADALRERPQLRLSVAPDWRVFAFTAAVSLAACVLAGLAPALHALRASTSNPALKEGADPGARPSREEPRRRATCDLDDPDRRRDALPGNAGQAVRRRSRLRERRS